MRNHVLRSLVLVVGLSVLVSMTFAQGKVQTNWGGQAEGPQPAKLPPINPNEKFDPHDFSGLWRPTGSRMMTDWKDVPPRTPEGEQLFQSRLVGRPGPQKKAVEPAKGNDPIMTCNPKGFPRLLFYTGGQAQFYHVPGQILQEFQSQGATRHIWMDGRDLPKNPDGRWLGYSVGRWEGDTLVVDTVGFNEKFWMIRGGMPHTRFLHLIERFTRLNSNQLKYEVTIDDKGAYTRTWSGGWILPWQPNNYDGTPGGEIHEYFCIDNERDSEHLPDR
jgi:hypothetical protein